MRPATEKSHGLVQGFLRAGFPLAILPVTAAAEVLSGVVVLVLD